MITPIKTVPSTMSSDQLAACPLCGEGRCYELYRFEPAQWIPGSVVRCANCATVYKKPSAAARPIANYYSDPRYGALNYWSFEEQATRTLRRILGSLVSLVGSNGSRSLLEIGCGPGRFLELAQERGFEVSGIELNAALADEARKRTGGRPIICDDFMTAPFSGQFDVIAMLDLIEHLTDPLAALRHSYEMLKPGGYLLVYTPNHKGLTVRVADLAYRATRGSIAGPVIEIFDCLHIVFFDPDSLRFALERSGFQLSKSVFSPYDPARNDQATGVSAYAVRGLEALGRILYGQFRMLMVGQKPYDPVRA